MLEIILIICIFINVGLLVWILMLDSRLEQMKGYIKRIDAENRRLLNDSRRLTARLKQENKL